MSETKISKKVRYANDSQEAVLVPAIPYEKAAKKTMEKGHYQAYKLRTLPADPDSPVYEIQVAHFESGTPEEWLKFMSNIKNENLEKTTSGLMELSKCDFDNYVDSFLYDTRSVISKKLREIKGNEKIESLNLQVCMINTNFSLNHGINIIELKNQFLKYNKFSCFYTPDTYPGLKIKYFHESLNKSSVFIFSSGQVVITGVKSIEDVNTVYSSLMDVLINSHQKIYNQFIQIKPKKKKNTEVKFGYNVSMIQPCLEL